MKFPVEIDLQGQRHIYFQSDFGGLLIHVTEDTDNQELRAEWINHTIAEDKIKVWYLDRLLQSIRRLEGDNLPPCEHCETGNFHQKSTLCLLRDIIKARKDYEEHI